MLWMDRACNVRKKTKLHFIDWGSLPSFSENSALTGGRLCLTSYLPLCISCCRMFFMKWIFLKLFGRGEPDRVRHLEYKTNITVEQEKKKRKAFLELLWGTFACTCVKEHFPQCLLEFLTKSAERWVSSCENRQKNATFNLRGCELNSPHRINTKQVWFCGIAPAKWLQIWHNWHSK